MFLHVVVAFAFAFVSRFLWMRWRYDLHRVPRPTGHPIFGHLKEVANKKHKLQLLGNDVTAKFLFKVRGVSPYQKAVRMIYATAMQSHNLKKFSPKIVAHIDKLIEIVEIQRQDGQVNLKELFTKLTVDVIGMLAFEINMGALDGSKDMHRLFKNAKIVTMDRFRNRLLKDFYRLFPWLKKARREEATIEKLVEKYRDLVHFFNDREDPPEGEQPMWYAFKTLKDPETGKPLEFKTLVAEVSLMVLAGMDTTAQHLGWILMLLAAHPEVMKKLLEELREHGLYGPDSRKVEFDDLADLSYLTAIIKEGMRIAYSLTAIAPRLVPKDMTILGYRIPKDTTVIVPGTRAISLEEEWGDPDTFRPERWLTGEDMSDKYNLAFSTGPRDCIGQKLAMLEMRLVVVKLITRYELKIDGDWLETLNSAEDGAIIEAVDGVWFHVAPRSTASV